MSAAATSPSSSPRAAARVQWSCSPLAGGCVEGDESFKEMLGAGGVF